jgi:hypothetical protein
LKKYRGMSVLAPQVTPVLQSDELLNKGLPPLLVLLAQPLQASRSGQEVQAA